MGMYIGHECWDHVSVWSCWGRCDSREISDWKFPYKKSYHPVCVHAGRSKAVAMLRFCHPQASSETRRYEYLEANACHCQVSIKISSDSTINFISKSMSTDLYHVWYQLWSPKQLPRWKLCKSIVHGRC